jgi:hypothetical protein
MLPEPNGLGIHDMKSIPGTTSPKPGLGSHPSVSGFMLALLVLLAAGAAGATEKESKERAARKACLMGDFAKGVEILSDLYLDTLDPTYLYNQGRCFEQNNRYEEAIARFREYLRKAQRLTVAEKDEVGKHIESCRALQTEKSPSVPVPNREPAAVAPGPVPPAEPPTGAAAPPSVVQIVPVAEPAHDVGRGLRIAGVGCGVAGLASIGTAIYFYTRARSLSDSVSRTNDASDRQAGERAETLQWVFYGAGGVALATGVVLYLVGWQQAGRGSATAISPLLGTGLAGLSLQGGF